MDNWDEYIESVDVPEITYNSFGEVEDFILRHCYKVKKEYMPTLDRKKSSVAMEVAYLGDGNYWRVKIGPGKKEYNIIEPANIPEKSKRLI